MATRIKLTNRAILLMLIISIFSLSACGKHDTFNKKDVIAYVNREPILESEIRHDIAIRARQDPMFKLTPKTEAEELETIINRKLIIQAAMEKGLAREERFVNTIRTFWEQTLIRDFVDYKQKEFQDYLFVTEDEIKDYYNNLASTGTVEGLDALRPEIEKRIAGEKETKLFEEWLKNERSKARVKLIKK